MSDYPLPSYAASIWIAGDQIWLSFPSPEEGARSHSVHFPNSESGLHVLLNVLRARNERSPRWIGTKAAPTKREIEEQLKRDKRYNEIEKALKVSAEEKAEAEKFLEELGL